MCTSISIKSAQSPLKCGDFCFPVLMFEDLHFVGTDGRHRFIVAQKYKLNLLVDVVENSSDNFIRNEGFLKRLFKKLLD